MHGFNSDIGVRQINTHLDVACVLKVTSIMSVYLSDTGMGRGGPIVLSMGTFMLVIFIGVSKREFVSNLASWFSWRYTYDMGKVNVGAAKGIQFGTSYKSNARSIHSQR